MLSAQVEAIFEWYREAHTKPRILAITLNFPFKGERGRMVEFALPNKAFYRDIQSFCGVTIDKYSLSCYYGLAGNYVWTLAENKQEFLVTKINIRCGIYLL